MKNSKSGFTLAEVLITLGIIGVIAAITMPAMISSYQYKSVGVKLAKFAAQLENSARPYVVQNSTFADSAEVMSFINESYLIKDVINQDANELKEIFGQSATASDYPTYYTLDSTELTDMPDVMGYASTDTVATLKDGTKISVSMIKQEKFENHKVVDTMKTGLPVFNISFDPSANGLPKSVQKNFNFVVTELGYVYPHDDDECLWDIYDKDFATNANTFISNGVCNNGGSKSASSD